MTAMIEAFSFLGPRGPVTHVFYDSINAAGICVGTIQARTHVQLALACQQSMIRVQHRLRFTMNTFSVIVVIWVTNAPITLLPLALMGLSLATMSLRVGFGTLSTLMVVPMGATISVKHLNDFSTFGQTLLLFIRTEFSIGNFHRSLCSVRSFRVLLSRFSLALSLLFLLSLVHCFPNK